MSVNKQTTNPHCIFVACSLWIQDQYKFVYDTLEEHIICGKTWFPVSELSERLKAKAGKDPATKMNEYQREYSQICKQTPRYVFKYPAIRKDVPFESKYYSKDNKRKSRNECKNKAIRSHSAMWIKRQNVNNRMQMWPVPAGSGLESNICVLLYNICFVHIQYSYEQAIRKTICLRVFLLLVCAVCVFGIVFFANFYLPSKKKYRKYRLLVEFSSFSFFLLAFISNIMHNFVFHILFLISRFVQ